MRAMQITRIVSLDTTTEPLTLVDAPLPTPGAGELLIRVNVCGVCHTELDEIEGRTPPPRLPVIPGHQVVGRVEALGAGCTRFGQGDRVGIGWIHHSDGTAAENLSPGFRATGRDVDGGYAEFMVVPESYACRIPDAFSDEQAAPLLCAGAIGYRSLRLCELQNGQALGLMGFGGSAHIVLQLAKHLYPDSRAFAFARSEEQRQFARALGADWAGDVDEPPPLPPQAIIDTTPAWRPVLASLRHLRPGGRLVINAIRKTDGDRELMAGIDYAEHLWMEKEIKSVANLCFSDMAEFLPLAAEVPIRVETEVFELEQANEALLALHGESVRGAKVLRVASSAGSVAAATLRL